VARSAGHGRDVDDEAVADVAGDHPVIGLVDLIGANDFNLSAEVVLGAEVEHSWVSRMPPINEPARLRRPEMSANAGTDSGSAGAPTLTMAPSSFRRLRWAPMSTVADRVETMRSQECAFHLRLLSPAE
jgi:hypothetical protein